MPMVPNLEAPSVEEQPLPGRPYPRLSDEVPPGAFGAGLGQGLEQLSDAGADVAARHKVENDNLRVIDANTQLEAGRDALLYGQNGQGGAFSLHGQDAMDLPNRLLPQYEKLAGNISSTLTPDQQRLFARHVSNVRNELDLQLNRYESEEGNRLAKEVYGNATKQAIEGASVGWRDPAVIGKARADIKGLVAMRGDHEGWDQSERDQQTQSLLAEMHYSVVDRMLADGKPGAALRYFVGTKDAPGVRDSNELTGAQSHQLGAAIDAAVRQQSAQLQASVATQIRDVRAAAVNGQLIPPSSMPSKSAIQAAFPDNWQELYSGLQRDIQLGSDLKSMASMTPAELAAKVESYRPTDVAGAAEGYERYNAAAAAAQRVQAERAKDPRQFVIDNKLGSQPLPFGDQAAVATELRARLASIPTLSQHFGGYVPPLTHAEATQLAQSFESMTPADRVRGLSSLSDGVNDDRGFQEIMRQILPGSPVTAIVGGQVGGIKPTDPPSWFDGKFAANPQGLVHILHGEELLNPQGLEKEGQEKKGYKGGFPMPQDGGSYGLRAQFADKTGDVFRNRPELGDAYFGAFKAAYASLLAEKGDLSGQGSSKVRDQAVRMVLGNLVQFHGQEISVPQGMDPSKFANVVDQAVTQRAIAAGAKPGWEAKVAGYQLRELDGLGSGRYELVNGNMPLRDPKTGGNFTIDLRAQFGGKASQAEPPTPHLAVQKPTEPADKAVKAPPIAMGGHGARGRGGSPHPSQGEPPSL